MTIPAALLLLCNVTFSWGLEIPGSADLREDVAPQEVHFESLDYRNVLRWEHHGQVHGNPQYFVQYKIYGEKHWTNATHCQGIRELHCDLSQEMSELREWYYARVQAVLHGAQSSWTLSPRFNSHWETSVSPPKVKMHVTEQGIMVQLRPPSSPYRRRNGSRIAVRKLQRLLYRVYLTHNGIVQEQHDLEGCVRKVLITDLKRRTTYCLQAETHILLLGRRSGKSQAVCVTTP
ncbi:interleukin-22 receptor subunit alpha-2-like [Anguilla rostrata]|uniref:interleukin-22 receptor subunit alpha-2-like n=1 Tax=Anguilla rostrata TaxID=7938 RepID=UPI0030CBF461